MDTLKDLMDREPTWPAVSHERDGRPGSRHGDPRRALVRRLRNNPWGEPAVSEADARELIKTSERGQRWLVAAVLPFRIVDVAENKLIARYGGFTAWTVRGGWKARSGPVLEAMVRFEVSVVNEAAANDVRATFARLGREAGEEWTHITAHLEFAYHQKTGSAA